MKEVRCQTGVLIIGAILLPLLICSCSHKTDRDRDSKLDDAVDTAALSVPTDSVVIEFAGVDSETVFHLLKSNRHVEYRSSVMGVFITAIDSIENGGGAYWIYSVNDSMPQVACDKYITKNGDVVKWLFRKAAQ